MTMKPPSLGVMKILMPEEQIQHLLRQLRPHERRAVQRRLDVHRDQVHLRQAVIDWLRGREWELFGHLTSRCLHTETLAQRLLHLWQLHLCRLAWGRNFWKRGEGVDGIAVIARQRRGDHHVHALISNTNGLDPRVAEDHWNRRRVVRDEVTGAEQLTITRLAKVERYRPSGGAIEYFAGHLGGERGGVLAPFGSWSSAE